MLACLCLLTICIKCLFSIELGLLLNELDDNLNGNVIFKGDQQFDKARKPFFEKYNELIPNAIIQCTSENDVIKSIKFLNENQKDVSFRIRSGGNSFGGYSSCMIKQDENQQIQKCIILDLSQLKNIQYDTNNNLISVEPGVNQYEFVNNEIHNIYNISVPHGNCPTVNFGGYCHGGGFGFLMRKYGLNIDYLNGVNIVLFDGSLKEISSSQCTDNDDDNLDLLWAIRGGGGGNFGVITKYHFNPMPIPKMFGFVSLKFPVDDNIDTIQNMFKTYRWYYDPSNNPSVNFVTYLTFGIEEDKDMFPYGYSMHWGSMYTPDIGMTNDVIIDNVNNIVNSITNYLSSQNVYCMNEKTIIKFDTYSNIFNEYIFGKNDTYLWGPWKAIVSSRYINEISDFNDEFINKLSQKLYNDIVIENSWSKKGYGPHNVIFESLGGNIQNEDDTNFEKTSFYGRQSWVIVMHSIRYKNGDQYNKAKNMLVEYDRIFADNIQNCPRYINYMDNIDKDLSLYYPNQTTFNKLKTVKTKYDPNNLFQFDMSIPCEN